jgi:hypothetical protein
MLQAGSSLHERLLTEVLAIEVEQIERIEDDAVGLPPEDAVTGGLAVDIAAAMNPDDHGVKTFR